MVLAGKNTASKATRVSALSKKKGICDSSIFVSPGFNSVVSLIKQLANNSYAVRDQALIQKKETSL